MSVSPTNAIDALQRAVTAKDAYTAGHNRRVSGYAANLAHAIGLNAKAIRTVQIGGQLHDVGKIGIRDGVLLKPGKLTADEFQEIQRHSAIGSDICEPLGLDPLVRDIIRFHHERLDGSGYPDGLRGSQIPVEVQIVGVADIVDALLTHRVYRQAHSMEETWDILHDEASRGLHDVNLVSECIRIMATGAWFASARDHARTTTQMAHREATQHLHVSEHPVRFLCTGEES